jgi:excisionase family DNA binding protein
VPSDFENVGGGWVGPLPQILTVDELCQYLRETPTKVRALLRAGEFPKAFRLAGKWKIPAADVIAYTEKMYGDTRTEKERAQQ